MNHRKLALALGGSLVLGLGSFAGADELADLKAELRATQSRVAELEGKQSSNWLDQKRAEEVKSLIREVLADADTRASLLADGAVAGHNGKNFYLGSADGSFLLTVGGQIQVRYVWNNRDDPSGAEGDADALTDDNEAGFELRRAKIFFDGHIGSPKFMYGVGLQASYNGRYGVNTESTAADIGSQYVLIDYAKIGYNVSDTLSIWAGEDKGPFLREELTKSQHQLAAERSLVNDLFTVGRIQGVWAKWQPHDMIKTAVSINDGLRSGEAGGAGGHRSTTLDVDDADQEDGVNGTSKDFASDATDIAFTARIDIKLAGDWDQIQDFSSWQGSPTSILLGAALHYEIGETGDGQSSAQDQPFPGSFGSGYDSFFMWTVDSSFKMNGLAIYAAAIGMHVESVGGPPGGLGGNDVDHYGIVGQIAYMVIPDKLEPFFRFEYISMDDPDSFGDSVANSVRIITFGANYYVIKHSAKLTVDFVWALDALTLSNVDAHPVAVADLRGTGLLLDSDDENEHDGQFALRIQFQLLF